MPPLSAVIMAENEADRIGAALRSVSFADEILVVLGSDEDTTRAVAEAQGAVVILHAFEGFISQRRFGLEQARHDWVLMLDADERVTNSLAASIQGALTRVPEVDGFELNRRNFYLGRPIRHAGWAPDWKLRLVNRRRTTVHGHDPHDRLRVSGAVGRLPGPLDHHSYRNLTHHAEKVHLFARHWADDAQRRGQRAQLLDLLLRPPYYFFRRYFLNCGFLEGAHGLFLCAMGAWLVFLKYAFLLESLSLLRSMGSDGCASEVLELIAFQGDPPARRSVPAPIERVSQLGPVWVLGGASTSLKPLDFKGDPPPAPLKQGGRPAGRLRSPLEEVLTSQHSSRTAVPSLLAESSGKPTCPLEPAVSSQAARETQDPRELQDSRDSRELQDSRDPRDLQDSRDPRDLQDSRDSRDLQHFRDPRDSKGFGTVPCPLTASVALSKGGKR